LARRTSRLFGSLWHRLGTFARRPAIAHDLIDALEQLSAVAGKVVHVQDRQALEGGMCLDLVEKQALTISHSTIYQCKIESGVIGSQCITAIVGVLYVVACIAQDIHKLIGSAQIFFNNENSGRVKVG